MLKNAEDWRKDFKVDEIVQCVSLYPSRAMDGADVLSWHAPVHRTFDFKEAKEVDKYYPQFYHKMDKVRHRTRVFGIETLWLTIACS